MACIWNVNSRRELCWNLRQVFMWLASTPLLDNRPVITDTVEATTHTSNTCAVSLKQQLTQAWVGTVLKGLTCVYQHTSTPSTVYKLSDNSWERSVRVNCCWTCCFPSELHTSHDSKQGHVIPLRQKGCLGLIGTTYKQYVKQWSQAHQWKHLCKTMVPGIQEQKQWYLAKTKVPGV